MGYHQRSLPLRECGLKLKNIRDDFNEINVTPLAGVWIEITVLAELVIDASSLPLRECGLKLNKITTYVS